MIDQFPIPSTPTKMGVKRRDFVRLALGTALVSGATALPATSAFAAGATPTLPNEISRLPNQISAVGKKLYDNIEVNIQGDIARIFVPQVVKPNQAAPVGVVWFYHGANSDSEAMNHGFKWNGEYVVDQGMVGICQTVGGTLYSNPAAQQIQRNGYAYLSSNFNIGVNYLRATSGGGALACGVYAAKIIPKINGLYMVNGMYDIREAYNTNARDSIGPPFLYNTTLIDANNPARATAAYWRASNVRVIVSDDTHPDTLIPPAKHGLALLNKITGTAKEASVRYHNLGHTTPDWATSDCMQAIKRWQLAL
jgi:hypothetical protein